MAFKEVVLTEEEQRAGSGRPFKKFDAIGDKALGFLVKKEKRTVNYKDGAKQVTKWIFFGKLPGRQSAEEFEITPTTDLEKKLKKAEREMGLVEGLGHLVKMTFSSTLKIEGRDDPMKAFTVVVDTSFMPQNPLPASVTWAKSKAAPRESLSTDDDIPF